VTRLAGLLAGVLIASTPACGGVEASPREASPTLERYGVAVTVPRGWHARLTRATVEASTLPDIPSGNGVSLGNDDLLLRLFEYEPEGQFLAETRRTHPEGPPARFSVENFVGTELGGDNPKNPGFARRNFSLSGRYFDLFVEAGAAKPAVGVIAGLNELVGSLEVRAGDFYPGTIEPPRFRPGDGWHAGSFGGGEVRAADHASAWASTVPYRNGPRDLPPRETLETLPPDGILIWVGIARDNRFPPTSELRRRQPRVSVPLQLGETKGGFGWEGQVREISLYRLWGWIGEQYNVDLWIFYGRWEPTTGQRATAQVMLDGLVLPDWGSWELDGLSAVTTGR
jgi:hypothetical protein